LFKYLLIVQTAKAVQL